MKQTFFGLGIIITLLIATMLVFTVAEARNCDKRPDSPKCQRDVAPMYGTARPTSTGPIPTNTKPIYPTFAPTRTGQPSATPWIQTQPPKPTALPTRTPAPTRTRMPPAPTLAHPTNMPPCGTPTPLPYPDYRPYCYNP